MMISNDETPTIVLASVRQRILALFLDALIGGIGSNAVFLLALKLSSAPAVEKAMSVILAFSIPTYFIIGNGPMGQTFGKRIIGIRVVSRDGRPTSWAQGILRSLSMAVSFAGGLGLWMMMADDRRRGFHDLVARTTVIVVERNRRGVRGVAG